MLNAMVHMVKRADGRTVYAVNANGRTVHVAEYLCLAIAWAHVHNLNLINT